MQLIINKLKFAIIISLPSVMFPGTEKFVANALDDQTVVLSNALVEKYKKENKSFNLEDKKAILVYPREISPEIKIIKKRLPLLPSIVSMVRGLSLHKIGNMKIDIPASDYSSFIDSFIKDSFIRIKPASPKFFYIKKLSVIVDGQEKTSFNDLFIGLQENKGFFYIDTYDGPAHILKGSITVSDNRHRKFILENDNNIEAIPNNSFLNSIYNYFVLNPKIAEEFNFDDIKLLLTKEELDILNNVGKKENIKKEEKAKSEKTKKFYKEEKVKQDKTSKEKKTEKVKAPETKDMKKKKIEASEAELLEAILLEAAAIKIIGARAWAKLDTKLKAQKIAAMKGAAIKEKDLAGAKERAAIAKAQMEAAKAEATKAKAQKVAEKAEAAKAKAQMAAVMKAKAIKEKALAVARAKAKKAAAMKAKALIEKAWNAAAVKSTGAAVWAKLSAKAKEKKVVEFKAKAQKKAKLKNKK